jgi:DNA repair protein SbcC/Rad50
LILKRIILNNIRSYKEQTSIEIPPGKTLFQGDIGCGKSTILSAIEFALFGLGDIDGCYLLRSGEKKGSISLEFEVKGKPYQIYRSLLKHEKNVVQDKCYIIDGDTTTNYSAVEMRSKILEIVNINEKPHTKATSVIYRYAIFTPQEMMKQILTEKQERRVEILRRAFGIEEYSIAKKNIDIISTWAKGEIRVSSEIAKDLLQKRTLFDERRMKADSISYDIDKMRDSIDSSKDKLRNLQKSVDDLKEKKDLVLRLETSIPYLKKSITKNQEEKEKEQNILEKLEADLKDLKESEEIVNRLKNKYEDYLEKREKLSNLEKSVKLYERLDKEKTRVEQSIASKKEYLELQISKEENEIELEEREIKEQQASIVDLQSLEHRETSLTHHVKRLPSLRKLSTDILSHISRNEADVESKKRIVDDEQKQIDEISVIGEGALCPKCKQKLTVEHISKVKHEFFEQSLKIKKGIDNLRNHITREQEKKQKIDLEISDLESKEDILKDLRKNIAKLVEKKTAIEAATKKLRDKKSRLSKDIEALQQEKYSLDERKKLTSLLKELGQLSEDKQLYEKFCIIVSEYESQGLTTQYIENLQEVKRKAKIESEVNKTESIIMSLTQEIISGKESLTEQQSLYDKNKGVIKQLDELQSNTQYLEGEISKKKEAVAAALSELSGIRSSLEELKDDITKKEKHRRKEDILKQTQNWFAKCFVPSIEDIEKYVLENIKEEFNQLFQRWFSILLEAGDISVEVDETFTPIVIQSGYSLALDSLSGGEKTSVAFAYRLSLNTMIKKAAGMESNLIILDEPTDGFGKEQLIKLRQVLDELDSAQVIMVSHERELESFVDTIYRITKEGGISTIESVV